MAKIKFGMMMTDARGKLGGQVFSKNRGGAYVRTKVTPSNARTLRQTFIRSLLASISAGWSALTASARNGFNEAVADWSTTDIFGDARNPSGKTLFTKLNMNLGNTGQALISAVPVKVAVPEFGETTVVFKTATSALVITSENTPGDNVVQVSATPPLSQGTSFYKGKFRQIGVGDGADVASTVTYSLYVAKFGLPKIGDNIAFELKRVMPNGQAGVPITVVAKVVV